MNICLDTTTFQNLCKCHQTSTRKDPYSCEYNNYEWDNKMWHSCRRIKNYQCNTKFTYEDGWQKIERMKESDKRIALHQNGNNDWSIENEV